MSAVPANQGDRARPGSAAAGSDEAAVEEVAVELERELQDIDYDMWNHDRNQEREDRDRLKRMTTAERMKERLLEVPRKRLLMSFCLFMGGAVLLIFGLRCLILPHVHCEQTAGMLVVGSIMMLPGGYSMFIIVNFIRGVRGYSWKDLPEVD